MFHSAQASKGSKRKINGGLTTLTILIFAQVRFWNFQQNTDKDIGHKYDMLILENHKI